MNKRTTKRRCKLGEECGMSCIMKGKTCHKDPPQAIQPKIEKMAAKVKTRKARNPANGKGSNFMNDFLSKTLTPATETATPTISPAPAEAKVKVKVDTKGMTKSEAALAKAKAEFARKGPKNFDATDFNDVGSLKLAQIEQLLGSTKKATPEQIETLAKGNLLVTYATASSNGANDTYNVVARGEFLDAAKRNKNDRAWILGIPEDPKQIALTKKLAEVPDKPPTGKLNKDDLPEGNRKGVGYAFSSEGKLMYLPGEDIKNVDKVSHGRSKEEVEMAAAELLKAGGRGWVPVYVQETSEYNYKVVGNSFAHDVYKAAGIDRQWSIVVGNGDNYREALSQ